MPKLRKSAADLEREALKKIAYAFRDNFRREVGDMETVAMRLGLSKSTLFRVLNDPERITVGMLRKLRFMEPEEKEILRKIILP